MCRVVCGDNVRLTEMLWGCRLGSIAELLGGCCWVLLEPGFEDMMRGISMSSGQSARN